MAPCQGGALPCPRVGAPLAKGTTCAAEGGAFRIATGLGPLSSSRLGLIFSPAAVTARLSSGPTGPLRSGPFCP